MPASLAVPQHLLHCQPGSASAPVATSTGDLRTSDLQEPLEALAVEAAVTAKADVDQEVGPVEQVCCNVLPHNLVTMPWQSCTLGPVSLMSVLTSTTFGSTTISVNHCVTNGKHSAASDDTKGGLQHGLTLAAALSRGRSHPFTQSHSLSNKLAQHGMRPHLAGAGGTHPPPPDPAGMQALRTRMCDGPHTSVCD
jgi:hypothetical protein